MLIKLYPTAYIAYAALVYAGATPTALTCAAIMPSFAVVIPSLTTNRIAALLFLATLSFFSYTLVFSCTHILSYIACMVSSNSTKTN